MINFSPGPSQLYFTAQDHMRMAFRESIPSLSHRSKSFENIFSATTEGLKELLNIPAGFSIVFCGSATEIWERSIQNLVEEKSLHLVNGAFSKRYFEIAQQLGKQPEKYEVPAGLSFDDRKLPDSELIAVTHNETSTGVSLPPAFIHNLKIKYPQSILIVDAVSSLPYPEFDFSKIDSIFFSVQKGFGLPAGLGVWIYNEQCLNRSEQLLKKGIQTGSYHALPQLHSFAVKNQTPETPNVLNIYLLCKVIKDMLRRGIYSIRKETDYKAATLYQALESHSVTRPFVAKKEDRSKTVIVADCGDRTKELNSHLEAKGFLAGEGYGPYKNQHLRFANFPTHSKEHFEGLADAIAAFR